MKWFQLHKVAKIVGSTLYRSIGLDTLKRQKEHHEEFIQKKTPKDFTLVIQRKTDHGMEMR